MHMIYIYPLNKIANSILTAERSILDFEYHIIY